MKSKRLPGKPLLNIDRVPMIVHVARQAIRAQLGKVVVACCENEVFETVSNHGIDVIMTDPELTSGTDRVYEAFNKTDFMKKVEFIINLQGDMPTINPSSIRMLLSALKKSPAGIATLACKIYDRKEIFDENVVKVGIQKDILLGKALYFSRQPMPSSKISTYHHIGIYAFKKRALKKFVRLKPTKLEKRENLEQLRAMEAGMRIYVKIVDDIPIGVDTASDLNKARKFFKNKSDKRKI